MGIHLLAYFPNQIPLYCAGSRKPSNSSVFIEKHDEQLISKVDLYPGKNTNIQGCWVTLKQNRIDKGNLEELEYNIVTSVFLLLKLNYTVISSSHLFLFGSFTPNDIEQKVSRIKFVGSVHSFTFI